MSFSVFSYDNLVEKSKPSSPLFHYIIVKHEITLPLRTTFKLNDHGTRDVAILPIQKFKSVQFL